MDWKIIGKRLLFPPVWLLVILTAASAVGLATVFIRGLETSVTAIAVYVLSFYTLVADVAYCVLVLPGQYRRLRQRISDDPLAGRYLADRALRSKVSLYLSTLFSMIYVGMNLWSWYWLRSWWFVVLAVYDALLAVIRMSLSLYTHRNRIGENTYKEWIRARRCAYSLLLLNLTLSAAVLMILYQDKGYDYPGIMIYVMALYTFYSTIHAGVDIWKSRKMASPVITAAKAVSLSAALVSMLNLETAMFAQFGGEMSRENQRLFIILTGAGVSAVVVTVSVLLAARATKEIRRIKHGQA